MIKKALIAANGYIQSKSKIKNLQNEGYKFLVGVDGGNNYLSKLGLIPDLAIGDFDSINPTLLKKLESKTKVIHLRRQNDTDVEKALKYLIKNNFTDVILLGGTGDRLDHSIANIGFVLKYFDKIRISIIHYNSILIPLTGKVELNCWKNEIISLYTFSPETIVSSQGLKYKLNKTSLMIGKKDSTSNIATGTKVKLIIENGVVCVVRNLKMVLQNGFI